MDSRKQSCSRSEDVEIRKGPWTMEEDLILINYIATHGEGVWNSLAKAAGLKRTGKSCRLRWLNYLRPDVRRGNISPEEQILIMDLHAKWGNRWSKIAKHLPGRTDNEIKNFWRTRIQKQLKQGSGGGGNDPNSSGQSYEQAGQSSSQLSTSGSTAMSHDPYSASSYAEPSSFQLSVNGGGVGGAGGGTAYLMLPPQSSSSHSALPIPPESSEHFWGMDPDPFGWPMHYYGDQGRLT